MTAMYICPRCQAAGLQPMQALTQRVLACAACGTHFPISTAREPADFPNDGCQCVIWRNGTRRCELWAVSGVGHLRVFDADVLVLEEPFIRGQGWARAAALRAQRSPDQ